MLLKAWNLFLSCLSDGKNEKRKVNSSTIAAGLIRRSQVAGHGSRVAGHRSQVAGRRSRVTGHGAQITGHRPQITSYEYNHYFVLSSWETHVYCSKTVSLIYIISVVINSFSVLIVLDYI